MQGPLTTRSPHVVCWLRFPLEGNDGAGKTLQVSNGKFVWYYRPTQNAYTRKPATGQGPDLPKVLSPDDSVIQGAANLLKGVTWFKGYFKSATRLPDDKLVLNKRTLNCYVIELKNKDRKIPAPYPDTYTIWIEKNSFKFRMIIEDYIATLNQWGSPPVTYPATTISVYPEVELNQDISDSAFHFTPPPGAHLVAAFPQYPSPPILSPKAAAIYSVILKSFSGSQVALSSFRGRPVLIDMWATWCPPCYGAFPELARIYRQTQTTGLVIISIDQDDIPKDAQAYIEKMRYPWRNFHDDGAIGRVFGDQPVPRTILINPKGEIVFEKVGPTKQEILTAIAKLGTRYSAVLR